MQLFRVDLLRRHFENLRNVFRSLLNSPVELDLSTALEQASKLAYPARPAYSGYCDAVYNRDEPEAARVVQVLFGDDGIVLPIRGPELADFGWTKDMRGLPVVGCPGLKYETSTIPLDEYLRANVIYAWANRSVFHLRKATARQLTETYPSGSSIPMTTVYVDNLICATNGDQHASVLGRLLPTPQGSLVVVSCAKHQLDNTLYCCSLLGVELVFTCASPPSICQHDPVSQTRSAIAPTEASQALVYAKLKANRFDGWASLDYSAWLVDPATTNIKLQMAREVKWDLGTSDHGQYLPFILRDTETKPRIGYLAQDRPTANPSLPARSPGPSSSVTSPGTVFGSSACRQLDAIADEALQERAAHDKAADIQKKHDTVVQERDALSAELATAQTEIESLKKRLSDSRRNSKKKFTESNNSWTTKLKAVKDELETAKNELEATKDEAVEIEFARESMRISMNRDLDNARKGAGKANKDKLDAEAETRRYEHALVSCQKGYARALKELYKLRWQDRHGKWRLRRNEPERDQLVGLGVSESFLH